MPSQDDTIPVSPHYAHVLADLAFQRGFDGYLLNFEYPLRAGGGVGQTRALAAWIALLNRELKHKVGPHAEAIWSVWCFKQSFPGLIVRSFLQV